MARPSPEDRRSLPPTVRVGVLGDALALHHLAAATFPLACTPGTPEAEKTAYVAAHLGEEHFARHLVDPARIVLVADPGDTGGALAGYTVLTLGEPTDADVVASLRIRPTVELARMYVDRHHHGTGVADLLMLAALDAARGAGAAGIWLGVSEENPRANAFYERHGFVAVGGKRFHIGDRWEDDVVRERAL